MWSRSDLRASRQRKSPATADMSFWSTAEQETEAFLQRDRTANNDAASPREEKY